MDPMDSNTEERIGLAPEMRSLDEDLDQLILNPTMDPGEDRRGADGSRRGSKSAPTDDPVQEQHPSKNWDLGPIGGSPKLAHIVDEAMRRMSDGEVRECDDGEIGKPKFGEIGIIEDGLDHELEEVTFIPGTQVPDDGTSSVEEVSTSKEEVEEFSSKEQQELEDLKLEAEDDGSSFIPGTAIPDNAEEEDESRGESGERDVRYIPGSPDPEIGVRIPEIEARFRDSLALPKLPASGGALTPDPPRHKISWGDDPPKVPTRHN